MSISCFETRFANLFGWVVARSETNVRAEYSAVNSKKIVQLEKILSMKKRKRNFVLSAIHADFRVVLRRGNARCVRKTNFAED